MFQNNGKLKLLIIVGTRPEIIRLAAVINKCRTYFDTAPFPEGKQGLVSKTGDAVHPRKRKQIT